MTNWQNTNLTYEESNKERKLTERIHYSTSVIFAVWRHVTVDISVAHMKTPSQKLDNLNNYVHV